ncbi:MAG TPA: hypothetical protein VES69_02840 [Pyrinomonadaceae bacterium]|nr:hypothetical protein [Pyrinomonadaceae bacterium]
MFTSLWVFYITFKARVKAFSLMDKQFLANLEAPVGGSRATARESPREDDWTVRTTLIFEGCFAVRFPD